MVQIKYPTGNQPRAKPSELTLYKSLQRRKGEVPTAAAEPDNLRDVGGSGRQHETDEGNPAELKALEPDNAETVKNAGCAMKGMAVAPDMPEHHKSALEMHGDALEDHAKGLGDGDPAEAMGKALKHMESLKDAPDLPEHHKESLEHHAGELSKALNDMGNPQEDGEEKKSIDDSEKKSKQEEADNQTKSLFDQLRNSGLELEATVHRTGMNRR
jgi:hypothetical protein